MRNAVQDNRALRHDTRTPLVDEDEDDSKVDADKPIDATPTDDKPEEAEPGN